MSNSIADCCCQKHSLTLFSILESLTEYCVWDGMGRVFWNKSFSRYEKEFGQPCNQRWCNSNTQVGAGQQARKGLGPPGSPSLQKCYQINFGIFTWMINRDNEEWHHIQQLLANQMTINLTNSLDWRASLLRTRLLVHVPSRDIPEQKIWSAPESLRTGTQSKVFVWWGSRILKLWSFPYLPDVALRIVCLPVLLQPCHS